MVGVVVVVVVVGVVVVGGAVVVVVGVVVVVVVAVDGGATVTVIFPLPTEPTKSTAQTSKVHVPSVVGVPLSTPLRSRISPIGGKPPQNLVQTAFFVVDSDPFGNGTPRAHFFTDYLRRESLS